MKERIQNLSADQLRQMLTKLGKNHTGMSKREMISTLWALLGL